VSSRRGKGDDRGREAGDAAGIGVICGRRWVSRADSIDAVREIAERFDGLRGLPGCSIIKENSVRSVFCVQMAGGREVIVKHYRSRGLRGALKYLFVKTKGKAEWVASRRMALKNLPVPTVLAYGERRRGIFFEDASLVVEAVPNSVKVAGCLPAAGDAAGRERRRAIFGRIAGLCAAMHGQRVFHADFHGGNLLAACGGGPDGLPELYVIDLHSAGFPVFLRGVHRVRSLGFLAHSLREAADLGELKEMCTQYSAAAGLTDGQARKLWPAIEREMVRRELSHIRTRSRRCLKNSSNFAVSRFDPFRIHRVRSMSIDTIMAAIDEHRRHAADGDAAVVCRTADGVVTRSAGVRVQEWFGQGLLRGGLRSRAMKAWIEQNRLAVRGERVAVPLAAVEGRSRRDSCYLVSTDDERPGERSCG